MSSAIFLPDTYLFPEDDPKEYDIKLREYLQEVSSVVNVKENGIYDTQESLTGGKYMNANDVYRVVVDVGQLPNNTIKRINHGINFQGTYAVVNVYGAATSYTSEGAFQEGIPLPFNGVGLQVYQAMLFVVTSRDFTPFTRSFVTIEYIK